MNGREAQEFEARRRRIGKFGVSFMARPGQKELKVMEAFEREAGIARKYAAEQGKVYSKEMLKKNPQNIKDAVKDTVLWNVDAKIHVAKQYDGDLRELGEYIAFKTNANWIHGPIKLTGWTGPQDRGAYNKSVKDNALDWSANKDLMRGTVACLTQQQITSVIARIDIICSLEFGMKVIKRQEQKAIKDEGCGYSGWNVAFVMKGCSIPAEIQVNTWAMMYAKMSKTDYTNALLGGKEAEYDQTESRMGFEGGLGHLFYEIWGADNNGPDGKAAAALARGYHDLARMDDSMRRAAAPAITQQINVFHTKLQTAKAKEVWGHRILNKYGSYKAVPQPVAAAAAESSAPAPVFRSIAPGQS